MRSVSLKIGGRPYTVACADGEEAHVRAMGKVVDERLQAMGDNLSSNDAKNLLFASLILADELHDRMDAHTARPDEGEMTKLREERNRLRQELAEARSQLRATADIDLDRLANTLGRLADTAEKQADALERGTDHA